MPNAQQVAVNTTPVVLTGPGVGENVIIRNTDATNVVYLGGNANNGAGGASALGTTTGFTLAVGATSPVLTTHTGDIYGVTANTTTVTVQVLRW